MRVTNHDKARAAHVEGQLHPLSVVVVEELHHVQQEEEGVAQLPGAECPWDLYLIGEVKREGGSGERILDELNL